MITGLSPGVGNAGELVGEWYQQDVADTSVDEKRAFSQPVSQSTEAIQVTLGIKSPGLTDLVDFFLVISDKASDPNCQYTVNGIDIDSRSFPITSTTHSSDISQLKTKSEDEQKRLWRDFRKGQNLTVKLQKACNNKKAESSEVNTFDFSLKGSSAAYRFVAGLKLVPIEIQNQPKVEIKEPVDDPAPKDAEMAVEAAIPVEEETSQSILFPLLGILFIVVLIVMLIKSRTKQVSTDSTSEPVSERMDPNIGDHSQVRETTETRVSHFQITPGTGGTTSPDSEQNITNLPRFKVKHVIDGDTVIVSTLCSERKIRLDAIDCPEGGQEWGEIATAGLIKLIGGKDVHVEEHEIDCYERIVATLYVRHGDDSEWMNVNERMVTLGHAWVMRKYYKHLPKHRQDKLNQLESWAKSKKVGLWKADTPVPPWNCR
ncbi:MAG: thermonuclease family protein [Gammaproteobacteria bacterium]